jgi:hypothetical protein
VLIFGWIGCILAVYTHFAPIPFPDTVPLMIAFVIIYGAISSMLQLLEWFVTKDIIFKSTPATAQTPSRAKHYYILRSNLPRYSDKYSVSLEKIKDDGSSEKVLSIEDSVSKWFYQSGVFSPGEFKKSLLEAIKK